MSAVILSGKQQKQLHQLEEALDVFLAPVDAGNPDLHHTPAADFCQLSDEEVTSIRTLEKTFGCLLLAYKHN